TPPRKPARTSNRSGWSGSRTPSWPAPTRAPRAAGRSGGRASWSCATASPSRRWGPVPRACAAGATAFASEKQSDPIDPAACEWPADYFEHPLFWFDDWPAELEVKTIALDPSKGTQDRPGDYAAFVLYGRDRQGTEYIEADLLRANADVLASAAVEHVRRFGPEGLALEANVFQALLRPLLQAKAQAEGVSFTLQFYENVVAKPVRIRRLTQPLAARRLRFKARSPGTALLVQQLKDFPNGEHDGGPDAAELARRYAIDLYNGRQEQRRR